MSPSDLVKQLRLEIIEQNQQIYRKLLQETKLSDVTDEYWIELIKLYDGLDLDQKNTLLLVMRQVAVDTTSNFLALLDGVTMLEHQEKDFVLKLGRKVVNGDLQDIFLEMEEGLP